MKLRTIFGESSRGIAYMLGGAALATAVAVTAQQSGSTTTGAAAPDCALSGAVNDAVNQKVKMLGMVSTDPAKYFSLDTAESCLGPIAKVDSDISDGIPDPLGYLQSKALEAMQKVANAAYGKACVAARGALGDYITRYNTAVRETNGAGQTIDSQIGKQVQTAMDGFGLDYNAAPAPAAVQSAAKSAVTSVTSTAQTSSATSSTTGTSSLGSMIFN